MFYLNKKVLILYVLSLYVSYPGRLNYKEIP